MDSTGDTVTVGGAERQGKSNPFQSDCISLVLQTLFFLSYIRLPPVEEALLILNDDGVTKQLCLCRCQFFINLAMAN